MQPDPSSEDPSPLFERLANRDSEAFSEIYRQSRDELLDFARGRVRREPELAPTYDEEDALASGMCQLWMGLVQGRLAPPDGIDDFLRLARTIVARRITAKPRELRAQNRPPSAEAREPENFRLNGALVRDDMDFWPSDLEVPETIVIVDDLQQWLTSLLCLEQREIVRERFRGSTINEIARRQGKSRRHIERMFQEIRAIWSDARRDP